MNTEHFSSRKLIDGFSTCFRQWKSAPIHCSKLHGYAISFHVTFEGVLDYRNWVVDFGFLKRGKTVIDINGKDSSIGDWFGHMFDHTVIVAFDDPDLRWFEEADQLGVLQLRMVKQVGCEMFAKLVYETLNIYLKVETEGRVRVSEVECFEHAKNSATYSQSVTINKKIDPIQGVLPQNYV